MRHIKILEGLNEAVEGFGYAIGEAQDFLDRNEALFCDLIDDVAAHKVTADNAKRIIRLEIHNANHGLNEFRVMRATTAREAEYPYPHPSLKIARVMVDLPRETA